jgi:UDP-MurNAc hydroxylase
MSNFMKVTLIADSCFLFEYQGVRILTDPWIGTPAYDGAWLQFPQPVINAKEVGRLDYIFISHIHEDHCDLKTLLYLDRSAKIVLMDRHPNLVENFLHYHNLSFGEVIKLRPRQLWEVTPSLFFEVVEADPAHDLNHLIDSSLIIHFDGKAVYFANDNPPYPALDDYLSRYQFDLALLPPVGGSGYPACYDNLTETEKLKKADLIRHRYHAEMLDCLRRLEPRLFCSVANSHVLAGKSALLNDFMAWPRSAASVYRYIADHRQAGDEFRPVLLLPGDTISLETEIGVEDAVAANFYDDEIEREAFIHGKAKDTHHHFEVIQLNPSISFPHLFTLAHKRLEIYLSRNSLDIPWQYFFAYDQEKYASVSLSPPYTLDMNVLPCEINRLIVRCDPRLLFLLLTGGFSWNIADASGFLRYNRCPDEYIFEMYIALNYFRI